MQRPKASETRLRRRVEVRYVEAAEDAADRRSRIGYSGNLSTRGMMIRTARVLAPGTLLKVDLKFPQASVTVLARVVWARQGPVEWISTGRIGMGVRFVDPPPELADLVKGVRSESAGA